MAEETNASITIGDLVNSYRKRYSLDNHDSIIVTHDFIHITSLDKNTINDLINNPERDISHDPIEQHINSIGFKAELIGRIYHGVILYDQLHEDIKQYIHSYDGFRNRDIMRNYEIYKNNDFSDDTDFCNGNTLRNRMRLPEMEILKQELDARQDVQNTKCSPWLTDEEIEYHYNRATKIKTKMEETLGKDASTIAHSDLGAIPFEAINIQEERRQHGRPESHIIEATTHHKDKSAKPMTTQHIRT